jgi:hypothetical protein
MMSLSILLDNSPDDCEPACGGGGGTGGAKGHFNPIFLFI